MLFQAGADSGVPVLVLRTGLGCTQAFAGIIIKVLLGRWRYRQTEKRMSFGVIARRAFSDKRFSLISNDILS